MTLRAAVELAAPHTWGAAVLPCVLGALLSYAATGTIDVPVACAVLLCAVLLQSAVNTLNDYVDFVSGNDRADNCPDPTDAALIYHDIAPKGALALALVLLGAAGLAGLFLLLRCGWGLLWFAMAGLMAILFYTVSPVSASALPVGEVLSGGAMGCALALASFYAQTGWVDWAAAAQTAPMVLSVGVIMYVNNSSDIEKDRATGRRTLPALLGRARAVGLLKGLLALELLCCAAVGFAWFPGGVWAILPCGAGLIWNGQKLVHSGLVPAVRVQSMGLAMQNNLWVFLTCAAVVVLHLLCVGGK